MKGLFYIMFIGCIAMQTTDGLLNPENEENNSLLEDNNQRQPIRKDKAIMVNDQAKVIARFIDDFTQFVESVVESVKSFWETTDDNSHKDPTKENSSHNFQMMLKYMSKSVQYGYQTLKSSIPVLRITKENVIEVSNVLPSVSITDFIEDLIEQFKPAFSRTFDHEHKKR